MEEASRHSRGSGNPGNMDKANLHELQDFFAMIQPVWMPAFAGMTNYDTVSREGGLG